MVARSAVAMTSKGAPARSWVTSCCDPARVRTILAGSLASTAFSDGPSEAAAATVTVDPDDPQPGKSQQIPRTTQQMRRTQPTLLAPRFRLAKSFRHAWRDE